MCSIIVVTHTFTVNRIRRLILQWKRVFSVRCELNSYTALLYGWVSLSVFHSLCHFYWLTGGGGEGEEVDDIDEVM